MLGAVLVRVVGRCAVPRAAAPPCSITRSASSSTVTQVRGSASSATVRREKKRQQSPRYQPPSHKNFVMDEDLGSHVLRGVSFSGAGWLIPFHLGALFHLVDNNLVSPSLTRWAGASGGSLVAAVGASTPTTTEILELLNELQRSGLAMVKQNDHLKGNVETYLKQSINKFLTQGVYDRIMMPASHGFSLPESGSAASRGGETAPNTELQRRLFVAVTRIQPPVGPSLISDFESIHDLKEALFASCFVPVYINRHLSTHFRAERVVDGGIPRIVPVDATLIPDAVAVCPMPEEISQGVLRQRIHIGPELSPTEPFFGDSVATCIALAFKPYAKGIHPFTVFRNGAQAAQAFIRKATWLKGDVSNDLSL